MNILSLTITAFLTHEEARQSNIESGIQGVIVTTKTGEDLGPDGAFSENEVLPKDMSFSTVFYDLEKRKCLGKITRWERTGICNVNKMFIIYFFQFLTGKIIEKMSQVLCLLFEKNPLVAKKS